MAVQYSERVATVLDDSKPRWTSPDLLELALAALARASQEENDLSLRARMKEIEADLAWLVAEDRRLRDSGCRYSPRDYTGDPL